MDLITDALSPRVFLVDSAGKSVNFFHAVYGQQIIDITVFVGGRFSQNLSGVRVTDFQTVDGHARCSRCALRRLAVPAAAAAGRTAGGGSAGHRNLPQLCLQRNQILCEILLRSFVGAAGRNVLSLSSGVSFVVF